MSCSNDRAAWHAHQQFPLFPNLPVEIRRIIWTASIESRIVEIRITSAHYVEEYEDPEYYTRAKPPATLSACQEARHELLKHYPFCYEELPVRFNVGIDILLLTHNQLDHCCWSTFLNRISGGPLRALRRLALSYWLHWETSIQYSDGSEAGDYESNDYGEYESFSPYEGRLAELRTAVERLSSLDELIVVYEVIQTLSTNWETFPRLSDSLLDNNRPAYHTGNGTNGTAREIRDRASPQVPHDFLDFPAARIHPMYGYSG